MRPKLDRQMAALEGECARQDISQEASRGLGEMTNLKKINNSCLILLGPQRLEFMTIQYIYQQPSRNKTFVLYFFNILDVLK